MNNIYFGDNMKTNLLKGMGRIPTEEMLENIERSHSWNESVISAHVQDNPQSMEDVEKAREGYIDFLYREYPQLKGFSRKEISAFTRRDLHYILHPEMEKYSMEFPRLEMELMSNLGLLKGAINLNHEVEKVGRLWG